MNKDFILKCIVVIVCLVLVVYSITIVCDNMRKFNRGIDALEEKEYVLIYSELVKLSDNINFLASDILYYYGELIKEYEEYAKENLLVASVINNYQGSKIYDDLDKALNEIDKSMLDFNNDLEELSIIESNSNREINVYLREINSINLELVKLLRDETIRLDELEARSIDLKLRYNLLKRENKKLLDSFQ